MKMITKILKDLIISKTRENRIFVISYLKELGNLGIRIYNITKDKEHLIILNNLSNIVKKYENNEKKIYKNAS